jgi:hypothetical protein
MIYIGIDVGLNGAISIINDDKSVKFFIMPTLGKTKKQIDLQKLIEIMQEHKNSCCVIEDVHAIHGCSAGSTFAFAKACMAVEAVCAFLKIPYKLVAPKTWQKEMHEGIPKMYKPLKKNQKKPSIDAKEMSKMAYNRLFPNLDARASDRCKNQHDGVIDSVLIAEYCRRKF